MFIRKPCKCVQFKKHSGTDKKVSSVLFTFITSGLMAFSLIFILSGDLKTV